MWNKAATLLILAMSIRAAAQEPDVPLPFAWEGQGAATLLSIEGFEDISFRVELSVTAEGKLSGRAFTNEGEIPVEQLFYGPPLEGARRLVLVMALHDEANPSLFILNGRSLRDRLFYGEVFTKKLDPNGEAEKGLELGDARVMELGGEGLPEIVERAVNECRPIGAFQIKGDFKKSNSSS